MLVNPALLPSVKEGDFFEVYLEGAEAEERVVLEVMGLYT